MTPDEAMRHKWLNSSSSHMSSSTSAMAASSVNANANANANANTTSTETITQTPYGRIISVTVSAPRQRATTVEDPAHPILRPYKGRKYVHRISTTETTDNAGHEAITKYHYEVKSKLNGSASSHALASSTQTTTSRHASTGDIIASLDPNLDDSGTFLPPIL